LFAKHAAEKGGSSSGIFGLIMHLNISFLRSVASEGEKELATCLARTWAADKVAAKTGGLVGKVGRGMCHLMGALIQLGMQKYVAWLGRRGGGGVMSVRGGGV
jgi:hypothetical protein